MPDNRIYSSNRIENVDNTPPNRRDTRSHLSNRQQNLLFTLGGNSSLAENVAQFEMLTKQEAYLRGELNRPPIPGTEQDSFIANPPLLPSQQDISYSTQTPSDSRNSNQQSEIHPENTNQYHNNEHIPFNHTNTPEQPQHLSTQEIQVIRTDIPTDRTPWKLPELVLLVNTVNDLKKGEKLTGELAARLKKNRLSPDEWTQVQIILRNKGISLDSSTKAYSYLYDYSRSRKQKRINTVLNNRAKQEVIDEVAKIINTTIEDNSSLFKDSTSLPLTRTVSIANLKTGIVKEIENLYIRYHNEIPDNQGLNILNSTKANYLAKAMINSKHRDAINIAIERAETHYTENISDPQEITKEQSNQDLSKKGKSKATFDTNNQLEKVLILNSLEHKLALTHEDNLPHSLERGTYLRNEITGMILQMPHQEDLKTRSTTTPCIKEVAPMIGISKTSIRKILEKDDVINEWYHYKNID